MGLLAIISGPSGVGKSTLIRELVEDERFALSVSATTRSARKGERDGVDYYFLSEESFREKIANNEFLEHAQVHQTAFYGTLRSEITRLGQAEKIALLDIDVQGAKNLAAEPNAMSIFIVPPTWEALVARLTGRGSESHEQLEERLKTAKSELAEQKHYDHIVVNKDLEKALVEIKEILLNGSKPKNGEKI